VGCSPFTIVERIREKNMKVRQNYRLTSLFAVIAVGLIVPASHLKAQQNKEQNTILLSVDPLPSCTNTGKLETREFKVYPSNGLPNFRINIVDMNTPDGGLDFEINAINARDELTVKRNPRIPEFAGKILNRALYVCANHVAP
jgi:hypothetical protein